MPWSTEDCRWPILLLNDHEDNRLTRIAGTRRLRSRSTRRATGAQDRPVDAGSVPSGPSPLPRHDHVQQLRPARERRASTRLVLLRSSERQENDGWLHEAAALL